MKPEQVNGATNATKTNLLTNIASHRILVRTRFKKKLLILHSATVIMIYVPFAGLLFIYCAEVSSVTILAFIQVFLFAIK